MSGFHPPFLEELRRRAKLTPNPSLRQFVVQHLYEDTLRLLLTSHALYPLDVVIGLGYSGRPGVVEALRAQGVRVLTPSYAELEETVAEELGAALERAAAAGHQLILHEVGGVAITAFHQRYRSARHLVRGALEITKQGVWAARRIPDLLIPQVNCAETRLKELEGNLVGDAVVVALDVILRELGFCMAGRMALVLGYGWVGRGVAKGLRAKDMVVACQDVDVIKQVAATLDGHLRLEALPSLERISVVVGAAGARTITPELIDRLPHRAILVSGSSKDVEIDVPYLRTTALQVNQIATHVEAFQMKGGRTLYLVNGGFPVNFLGSSVPDEVVEFLFAEALLLLDQLAGRELPPGTHPLAPELEILPAQVWLDLR